jgi:hypothetical protein
MAVVSAVIGSVGLAGAPILSPITRATDSGCSRFNSVASIVAQPCEITSSILW